MKDTIKKIAYFGVGIALYFVLGMIMNIPLLAGTHLQTDLGYIAFGVFLVLFGWQAFIVGVIGCMFESLLLSGWIPIGWMLGQVVIGMVCGCVYKNFKNRGIYYIITILAVFVGIGLVKTEVECVLYTIPFGIKFAKNFVAFIADVIPMLVGMELGIYLRKKNIIK